MKLEEFISAVSQHESRKSETRKQKDIFIEEFTNKFSKLKFSEFYTIIDGEVDSNKVFCTHDNHQTRYEMEKFAACEILNGGEILEDYKGVKDFMNEKSKEWIVVLLMDNDEIKIISNYKSRAKVLGAILN